MSSWQPIETAPKDAKRIELWIPPAQYNDAHAVFGHWNTQSYNTRSRPYWSTDEERLLGTLWVRERQPTHWRPMSEGPTQETMAVMDSAIGAAVFTPDQLAKASSRLSSEEAWDDDIPCGTCGRPKRHHAPGAVCGVFIPVLNR